MGGLVKESEQRSEISTNTDFCSLFHDSFLIAGVGSPLRQDDQAGLLACDELINHGVNCVKCEYGLETCIGEIAEYRPRTLLVIDASIFKDGKPGDILLATDDSISSESMSLTTHSIPFEKSIELLRALKAIEKAYVIGIYPKSIDIGLEISFEVVSAVRHLVDKIKQCIMRRGELREEEQ